MNTKRRKSTYELMNLPEGFGVVLLTVGLILALTPFFAGSDFGVFKVPSFNAETTRLLRFLGPAVFTFLLILFIPIWRSSGTVPETSTAAARGVDQTSASTGAPWETPQLGKAWNVPHSRNRHFTGRVEQLQQLRAQLESSGTVAVTQAALVGLGGVGKTQLAVEYAYTHAEDYEVVWWIRAEDPKTLAADYAGLAEALRLPERTETEQAKVVVGVSRWLRQHEHWLLIFDNANAPSEVHPYTAGGKGHVIITSRNPNWGGQAETIPVETWSRSESISFLRERGEVTVDDATLEEVADLLGDLPLALAQAGAYMEETATKPEDYAALFTREYAVLMQRGSLQTGYQDTVATTWELAVRQLPNQAAGAAELLSLFAFLAPDDIPLAVVRAGAASLPTLLGDVAKDEVRFKDAVAALRRFSLIDLTVDAASVHRLVQLVERNRLSPNERDGWCQSAIDVLAESFTFSETQLETWRNTARLVPHVIHVRDHAESMNVTTPAYGNLLSIYGRYALIRTVELTEARQSFVGALRIAEATYGQDHPAVAIRLCNLASTVRELGDAAGAKSLFERALRIDEATYGPDHPEVAVDLSNLGGALKALGDAAGAKPLYERALRMDEATYGPDHPEVAVDLSNLGSALQALGDAVGAKPLYERSLRIDEATYGQDHPAVATRLNNLGGALKALGDAAGAKPLFERALRINEATYGPDHPEVAVNLNNLGGALQALGDAAGAKPLHERSLRIVEATYGQDHPAIATRLCNLASTVRELGDAAGAKPLLERALRIDEATYGPDHPEVAGDLSNLGGALRALGDAAGARPLFERALRIAEATLGAEHPTTVLIARNLKQIP